MADRRGASGRVYIAQGEQAIGSDPDLVISTILGSCVSVCLWDPVARRGGMNHILLPDLPSNAIQLRAVGAGAMERLINALVKTGADKARLEAKVFGGAAVVAGLSDIGARNVAFARGYLEAEAIPCIGSSTGGQQARQVRFWPESGRARMRLVQEQVADIPVAAAGNAPELF